MFEAVLDDIVAGLSPANHAMAVEIAALPRQIRGFGPIKTTAVAEVQRQMAGLRDRFAATTAVASCDNAEIPG